MKLKNMIFFANLLTLQIHSDRLTSGPESESEICPVHLVTENYLIAISQSLTGTKVVVRWKSCSNLKLQLRCCGDNVSSSQLQDLNRQKLQR